MFSPEQIANLLGSPVDLLINGSEIREIGIDSRALPRHDHALFVALKGKRHDGHDFISTLYDEGVRHFVVHPAFDRKPFPNANFYTAENGVMALQKLARSWRQQLSMPVLGITGSNGKTIVKEWLTTLLNPHSKIYRSPGSYNSQLGVALSVLGIKKDVDLAIIEAGISRPGEMSFLKKMIEPDYGIFTHFGDAHDAGFEDQNQKLEEKISLFQDCPLWIAEYRVDLPKSASLKTWSRDIDAQHRVRWNGKKITIDTAAYDSPFADQASLENLTHCLLFTQVFCPDKMDEIQASLSDLTRVSMRTDVRKGIRNNLVISDYYNSDLEALSNVLNFYKEFHSGQESTLVLSEFVDNREDDNLYDKAIIRIKKAEVDQVVLIGSGWERHIDKLKRFNVNVGYWKDTSDFLASGETVHWRDRLIILKGARIHRFEQIEKLLIRPVYGTRLEVDLSALNRNWRLLEGRTKPEIKKMVMVKASAYGSGSEELSHFYQDNNVDYLGVAFTNEGLSIREDGIDIPIMVMNAEPSSYALIKEYNLEPEIHGLAQLRAFLGEMSDSDVMSIHIKCETGMNRLGFEQSELPELLDVLLSNKEKIKVQSIFSHLSSADEPEADEFTRMQLNRFDQMYDLLSQGLSSRPLKHICNSAGMLRFPEAHYDMVRLGIAMYGCGLPQDVGLPLEQVHSLKTYIAQVKERHKGDLVGYGREGVITNDTCIATLPIGYADGITRNLGNGHLKVAVGGDLAPTVGRICMDMMMIDVTDIPGVDVYDEVEIFGNSISLDTFADQCGTIPYEVLVRLGGRIERVFTKA